MKKITCGLLAIVVCISAIAQNDHRKRSSLGIHFIFVDFKTAADIRATNLKDVLKGDEWYKMKDMNPGLAVSYIEGITNHLDFTGTLSAAFVKYPIPDKSAFSKTNLLLDLTATANLKLLTDKYCVSPYAILGVGASMYKNYFGAFIPAGLGLQVNINNETYLLMSSQYRMKVTDNTNYHFYHSLGFAGALGKKKIEAPKPLPVAPVIVPKDTDGDGVADTDDKCPDVVGIASLYGCPDKDGDAIADTDDKCPDVAGLAKYGGCPIPDTDKDGVNDEEDKCVDVAGVARYGGCPVPDTDKDGVNDEEDKCPALAGLTSNSGCPEIAKKVIEKINYAAQNILFATGSDKLLATSFKSLNEVATIMAADESLQLDIDGHTDNTGTPEKNKALSEKRANAVKAYLKSKGVDESRMTATGYGPDKPIADNKTPAGRTKNRRVEMHARNF